MIERIHRLLLSIYPAEFRERFGEEILDTARQLERDRRGLRSAVAGFSDAAITAVALRFDRSGEPDPFPPRESSMHAWMQDARFALRGLRRDPLFAAFAILTLGLGLGANAAMFGIVDRLLLRGPDYVRNADRVVRVYVSQQPKDMRRFTSAGVGYVTYDLMSRQQSVFSAVANYANNEATIGRGSGAHPARAGYASGTFFNLLGVRPALGSFFGAMEDTPNQAAHVAVLSYGAWVREFGGQADAIGKTLVVSDEPYQVIGVAPSGFTGADIVPVDVWLPMNLKGPRTTDGWMTSWSVQWMDVIGRLRDGESPEHAAAVLTNAYRAAYSGDEVAMRTANVFVAPLRADDSGSEATEARVAGWLMGVSAIMLLIVCANLVNLLLARAIKRGREIAIRIAVGAGAARIRRLLIVESLAIAAGASAVGLLVAYVLGGVARTTLLPNVVWTSSPVDLRVLGLSMGAALVVGLVVGLIPALRAGSLSLASALKSGTREGGGQSARLRTTLTTVQAALSVALLIGAGLFVRSLTNARSVSLGIEPEKALIVELRRGSLGSLPDGSAKDAERVRRKLFPTIAVERLRGIPGVTHAAVAVGMPFGNRFSQWTRVPGRDSMPRLSTGGPSLSAVSPEYFATVGTRILQGNGFAPTDGAGTERVAIVSQTMAKVLWPGRSPVGQCLLAMTDSLPCARIVGVAEDTHRSHLREEPTMHYYIPLGQEVGFGGSVILVRGTGDARVLMPDVRKVLTGMDASISYVDLETVQDRIDPQMRPWKLGTAVLTVAGVFALIVAVAGIFSVTSYLVTLRTREIGVRVALGATVRDVATLVSRSAIATAAVGVIVGSVIALLAGRLLEPLLFNESPRDPVVYAGVAATLIAASLLACVIPGIRASRINPVDVLRSD